ncbi:MAG TPA: sensor histidine kinase [Bryobacteraceae bacterium]|nr:sensor histidine kinase [Bryobacteraceae bacterium]
MTLEVVALATLRVRIVEQTQAMQREITQGSITRVLVIGFSLVIILLVFGGSIALRNILSIQENAAKLVHEQDVTRRLIEDLQAEQKTLSAIFYTLTGDPDTADPATISHQLDLVEKGLQTMSNDVHGDLEEQATWSDLLQSVHAFGVEARRLLGDKKSPELGSRDLFRRHEQVFNALSKLVGEGFRKVSAAEREIDRRAGRFNHESLTLLCASLGLALVCSIFTVRMTRELFRNMTWQESELTRVSWHMLADQESIARRFSHELHDELGQTLAAVKSNLAAVPRAPANTARLEDTTHLVDDAIRSVRQLSQLLRPMILDDFGLDAGLGWLCEGFMQRTGVEVDYQSNMHARLPDETETHLFRIAQEALTNVARHSGATKVSVELHASDDDLRLTIADNGRGLQGGQSGEGSGGQSLGMTGMRARARAVGGVFRVVTPDEGGLTLEAKIPLSENMQTSALTEGLMVREKVTRGQ